MSNANQIGDFARVRKSACIEFRVDQGAVESNIVNSTASRYQFDIGIEILFEFGRQTCGTGSVVSLHAKRDSDCHRMSPFESLLSFCLADNTCNR